MKEEEYFSKNYPDACWGDRPLSPYWDYFQSGVEFGERQSAKQIQIDAEQILALQKQNGELTDKVDELKKRNSELAGQKASLERWLGEAKEIIREYLTLLDKLHNTTIFNIDEDLKHKAEAFLKE